LISKPGNEEKKKLLRAKRAGKRADPGGVSRRKTLLLRKGRKGR